MEIVVKMKKENLQKVKNLLLKDETVSRASIIFKEGKSLGLENEDYYCYISGTEEACKRVEELIKELGEIVKNEEKKKVIEKIREEEESAMKGFGSIFG